MYFCICRLDVLGDNIRSIGCWHYYSRLKISCFKQTMGLLTPDIPPLTSALIIDSSVTARLVVASVTRSTSRAASCGFWLSFGRTRNKEITLKWDFHSSSITFRVLPKQLKLVGTGRNWFDPV